MAEYAFDDSFSAEPERERSRQRVERQAVLLWVAFDDLDSLRDADLTGMDLSGADLWGVDFRRLDLRGCRFDGSNFLGADLRNADVRGCSFRDVYLGHTHMAGAIYDDDTVFPDDFEPVENLMLFFGAEL
ncbi:pentapeptide repeat-containing protein [Candidatus Poribacteria bacterium]|nr:pentapeptide repeat-containing protein [Candidatus Poribacteria bacterium]